VSGISRLSKQLVTKPIHSITNQTFDSKLRFPSSRPFNADGFGIGYYEPPQASDMPEYSSIEESDVGSEGDEDENVGDRSQGATLVAYEGGNDGPQVKQQEVQIGAEKVTGSDRVKRKLELAAIESERPGLFKSIHPVGTGPQLLFLPLRFHRANNSQDTQRRFRFYARLGATQT
jgi:glutamine amidotransferase